MLQINPVKPSRQDALKFKGEAPQQAAAPQAQQSAQPMAPVAPGLAKVYFSGLEDALKIAKSSMDQSQYAKLHETRNFFEYLGEVYENPRLVRTTSQRVYDWIHSGKVEDSGLIDPMNGDKIKRYEVFEKPAGGGGGLVGMEVPTHRFAKVLEGAARGGEIGNRVILMVGPVGAAKSMMTSILKRGVEQYSRTDEGKLYRLRWANLPEQVAKELKLDLQDKQKEVLNGVADKYEEKLKELDERKAKGEISQSEYDEELRGLQNMSAGMAASVEKGLEVKDDFSIDEPMNVDPLTVISDEFGERTQILNDLNETFREQNGGLLPYRLKVQGELPPVSDLVREKLREYYKDKLQPGETLNEKVLSHVEAVRMVFDETKRVGIATYQPKDEKNQDSDELTGGVDFVKLLRYGDPTHALAKNYAGEFNIANRGMIELVEALKLQKEFLYDLLTVAQERLIKPKDSPQIPVDILAVAHTNRPEFEKLLKDRTMEALQNRFLGILVPYLSNYKNEVGIYKAKAEKEARDRGVTIAPHTLEIASLWAVMTRLKDSKIVPNALNKAKLYAGDAVSGRGPESVAELKEEAGVDEAHYGVSPRVIQNAVSFLMTHSDALENKTVTPKLLLQTIRKELKVGLINDSDRIPVYLKKLDEVEAELDRRIRMDVFAAFYKAVGRDALRETLDKYVYNLRAWQSKPAVANVEFLKSVEKYWGVLPNDINSYRKTVLELLTKGDPMEAVEQDETLRKGLMGNWIDDELTRFLQFTEPGEDKMKPLVDELVKRGYNDVSAKEAIQALRAKL